MGFFDSLGKLGKAAVGTVMLPVDVIRDMNPVGEFVEGGDSKVVERAKKLRSWMPLAASKYQ